MLSKHRHSFKKIFITPGGGPVCPISSHSPFPPASAAGSITCQALCAPLEALLRPSVSAEEKPAVPLSGKLGWGGRRTAHDPRPENPFLSLLGPGPLC